MHTQEYFIVFCRLCWLLFIVQYLKFNIFVTFLIFIYLSPPASSIQKKSSSFQDLNANALPVSEWLDFFPLLHYSCIVFPVPNQVSITRYGDFGVTRLTTIMMTVDSSVAIMQALNPREIGMTALSINRYNAIPLRIPATAPYSLARFQNSPRSTVWKNATVRPPVA